MRIVIIGTPRSGNTWLRHLLASLYQIPQIAVHNPADLDWDELPEACVIGIHWHPLPPFLDKLQHHGFRVVSIARHPLDVLISILHFAMHQPTHRWLEGEGGDERGIFAAMPRSTVFLAYATGARASALLSVSPEWFSLPDVFRVRYEDLIADPARELAKVMDWSGRPGRLALDECIAANTLGRLRQRSSVTSHFWQGRCNLWRDLLTSAEAGFIATAQAKTFSALGYACNADSGLDAPRADANWVELMREDLQGKLHQAATTDVLRHELSVTKERLAPLADLGPRSVAIARILHRLHSRLRRW